MKIDLKFYHVLHSIDPKSFPEKIEIVSEIDSNTTLEQLFKNVGHPYADLSEYYPLSGVYCFNESFLPFVITEKGIIEWNVAYRDVRVIDFLYTHKIENYTIISKIGYAQCSGAGFKDILELWDMVYPILDQILLVTGVVSLGSNAKTWFETRFRKLDNPPQTIFDLIYSRAYWNHTELADLLGVDYEASKQLLKIMKYSYDNSRKLYIQQSESLLMCESLSNLEVHDI